MSNRQRHAAFMRALKVASALIVALFFLATTVDAQNTFEVISQGAVGSTTGLRAMTIRDNSMSACYTLFIVQSSAGPATFPGMPSDDATAQSIERVRALAAARDKQLAEIDARINNRVGKEALALPTEPAYEQERLRVDLEYQRALRREIPESYPWASLLPGTRSGGLEDAANATRRATVDPDPTSVMKTLASQFAVQVDLLRLLIEAPRITASGPFACPARKP